jgi:hypothetical protein
MNFIKCTGILGKLNIAYKDEINCNQEITKSTNWEYDDNIYSGMHNVISIMY